MALSEREQKLLDELERGLYESDSSFVNRVSRKPKSSPAARLVTGVLLAIIGLSVLVFSVVIQLVVFGVVGFALMLGGLVLASTSWSGPSLAAEKVAKPRKSGIPSKNFFEDRWDKRQGG
jgi:hypothetical protein